MPSLRSVTHELLDSLGLTTMFGNPGSTEMTMLDGFPDSFDYYLGLHEAAVVAMADGWTQVTRRPAMVNVHTAPGLGNAMGSIITASWSRAPLVVTAGQQVRAMITAQHWLVNVDATVLPRPAVKWSFEPPRPEDVPAAIAKAAHLVRTPPTGPVFLSLPMDDWDVEVDPAEAADLAGRELTYRAPPDPSALERVVARIDAAKRPALVLGAAADLNGGWDAAGRLVERAGLEVWAAPSSGRNVFAGDSPWFRGFLPFGARSIGEVLGAYDLVVVVGAPVFTCYPYEPGRMIGPGTELVMVSDDPDELARAPLGEGVLGDPAAALRVLADGVAESERRPPEPDQAAGDEPATADGGADAPPSAEAIFAALGKVLPSEVRCSDEAPSSLGYFHKHLPQRLPDSYLTTPSGGLGYGLAAGVGAALADNSRPVLAILGDGSLQYTLPALWTAAQHDAPVVTLVLANGEYGILKAFARFNKLTRGIPGLDLPGLDSVALAHGYGVSGERVAGVEATVDAVAKALERGGPALIETAIDPTIPPLI